MDKGLFGYRFVTTKIKHIDEDKVSFQSDHVLVGL